MPNEKYSAIDLSQYPTNPPYRNRSRMNKAEIAAILENPEAAILKHWGNQQDSAPKDEILTLIQAIKTAKKTIKQLKNAKSGLSSQFKDKSLSEEKREQLKMEVKASSQETKQQESSLNKLTSQLLQCFTDTSTSDSLSDKPLHFSELTYPYITTIKTDQTKEKEKEKEKEKSLDISVKPVNANEQDQWNQYVQHHPCGSSSHLYNWKHIIKKSFQHDSYYLAAFDNQTKSIKGIFPVSKLDSSLFGRFLVSVPYLNYGSPLADSPEIEKQLLSHAKALCQKEQLSHLEVRSVRKLNDWPVKTDKVAMLLALPNTAEELDKSLGAKLRSQVKKSRQYDLKVCIGKIELIDDFYTVFTENMRDLGTPVYSKQFFLNIAQELPSASSIVIVYRHKKPVSCAFLIGYSNTLEIPWASTLRRANAFNANMLLYREILGFAIEQNYDFFDFGRSSKDAPTYQFKKQWGAKPVQHYWHYWLPNNESLPELNPNNPKYQLAIKVWQRLPIWLTKIIGPPIVKNLP